MNESSLSVSPSSRNCSRRCKETWVSGCSVIDRVVTVMVMMMRVMMMVIMMMRVLITMMITTTTRGESFAGAEYQMSTARTTTS